MSKTVTVLHNQSLLDISIQEFGSVEAVMQLAVLNDISITDDLVPGQNLSLEGIVVKRVPAVLYNYKSSSTKPKVKVLHNQSLLDISIQEFGSVEAVMQLAILNNISITDQLTPGQSLSLEGIAIYDESLQNYYYNKQLKPATALNAINDNAYAVDAYIVENYWV